MSGSTPWLTSGTPSRIVLAKLLVKVAAVAAAATPAPATIVPAASAAPERLTTQSMRMFRKCSHIIAHSRLWRSVWNLW